MSRWWSPAAGAVAAGAVAGLVWPVLTGAAYFAAPDYLAQFVPYLDFATRHWKAEGALPLWLPHLFGGMPFLASMNTAVLYPTEIVAWLTGIPAPRFYGLDAVIHHGIAAFGAAALFAFEGVAPFPACAGGILYSLAGVTLTQLGVGSVNFHRGAAWLPALVLAVRSGSRGRLRHAAAGGLIAGLLCLTYAVQLLAFGLLWAAALGLADRPGEWRRLLASLAITGLGALAVGAIWWIPAAEYWIDSTRRAPPEGFGSTWALRPRELLEVVRARAPAGAPGPGEPDIPARMSIAVGGVASAFALLGVLVAWRRRGAWIAAGLLAIGLSLGPGVFPGNVVALLPGFSGFRGWGRWIQLATLALALFAAEGFAMAVRMGERSTGSGSWRSCMLPGVFVAGMIAELSWIAGPFVSMKPAAQRPVVDAIGAFLAGQPGHFRTQSEEDDRHISWRIPRDLEFMSGHHTIPSAAIFRFAGAAVQSGNPYPYLGRMNCRYLVTVEPRPHPALQAITTVRGVTGTMRWIYLNRMARERIYSVRRHRAVRTDGEALRTTLTRRWTLDEVALTGHPEPVGEYDRAVVDEIRSVAGRTSAVVSSKGRALVTIAEIADPGWRITLDGSRCPAWRADGFMIAVAVPAGRHQVTLRYDPVSFRLGLWMSVVALAVLTLLRYRRERIVDAQPGRAGFR